MSKQKIQNNICTDSSALADCTTYDVDFEKNPKNNVYDTLEIASALIGDQLYSIAGAACSGAHGCGQDEYSKQFYVGSTLYEGISKFKYNQTTYYYIVAHEFTVNLVPVTTVGKIKKYSGVG
jgi:hypothetical protein